jgi:FOG: CBS domain
MSQNVVSVGLEEPVYEAFTRIGQNGLRGLPIVDQGQRCVGLISTFKITEYLFPPRDKVRLHREVRASLKDVIDTIGGALLAGRPKDETAICCSSSRPWRPNPSGEGSTVWTTKGPSSS